MDEHNEDEEAFSLTEEGAKVLLDFAMGQETKFDDMPLGCVMVAMAMTGLTMRDLDLSEDELDMPLREMPATAETLRNRLRGLIEQRVAEQRGG